MNLAPNQNPFSLYDFIGYLIPGSYAAISIIVMNYYLTECTLSAENPESLCQLANLGKMKLLIEGCQSVNCHVFVIMICLISLYILGQIISIFSNIIIERLPYVEDTHQMFNLLLKDKETADNVCCLKQWGLKDKGLGFIRVILFWLIPILPVLVFFVIIFPAPPSTVVNPLNKYFSLDIKSKRIAIPKLDEILRCLYDVRHTNYIDGPYFHYIYHLVLEKCSMHIHKINNYVALYGFMRNMLMANIFVFYYVIFLIYNESKLDGLWYLLAIFEFLNGLYFYGYMKYKRRYTEEVIFAACTIK